MQPATGRRFLQNQGHYHTEFIFCLEFEESELFQAHMMLIVDLSDIESLLGRSRSPILMQLHKGCLAWCEVISNQIGDLKAEIKELKLHRTADMDKSDGERQDRAVPSSFFSSSESVDGS